MKFRRWNLSTDPTWGSISWIFNLAKGLLGCDIGGAKELGVIYFPTNWGAKEPQNLRVD